MLWPSKLELFMPSIASLMAKITDQMDSGNKSKSESIFRSRWMMPAINGPSIQQFLRRQRRLSLELRYWVAHASPPTKHRNSTSAAAIEISR
ncbi:uncharacterized protein DS421_15g494880 [Arachis hypogaea]|nr:uncharacterized protein DS421_15g494880 [Arachis hypogaea]